MDVIHATADEHNLVTESLSLDILRATQSPK